MVELRPTSDGSRSERARSVLRGLRRAGPALAAYAAVRILTLGAFIVWSLAGGTDPHARLVRWDSQWYKRIAQDGYGFTHLHADGRTLPDLAFFPLYPGTERVVSGITGLSLLDAGLLVSWVASLVAAWGIFAVGDHLHGRRVATVLVVLWAALPVGIVQSMAYSESLFTALAAWSLYAVLTGRWVWAGALAALAGLTRPVGAAVAAAVIIPAVVALLRDTSASAVRARGERRSTTVRRLTGVLIAPLGWLGYAAWVGAQTGEPLGYLKVARDWGNGFDGGWAFARWTWELLTGPGFLAGVALCAGLVLLGWLYVVCVRQGQPLALLLFSGVLILLTLTTAGYFGSKPRYLLPAFPLLLPIAVVLAHVRMRRAASVLVALAAGSTVYGAWWLNGPGPP